MTAKDVYKTNMGMADFLLKEYVSDLSDADILQRPAAGLNPLAWQIGHLIASEQSMLKAIGKNMPDLPAGFEAAHNRDAAASDKTTGFLKKDQYLALNDTIRAATLKALDTTPDAELDKPSPESFRAYAPTVGAVFGMIASHVMMHVGQFVPLRRKLNKPVKI